MRRGRRLGDLTIGTQLRLGFGLIVSSVLLLAGFALFEMNGLWEQTKGFYEHPLTVRRTLDTLTIDILSIHRDMRDLILADNEHEFRTVVADIELCEANAYQQVTILDDRYLGPIEDRVRVRNDLTQWRPIREEVLSLLRSGNAAKAKEYLKPSGVYGAHAAKLWIDVQAISTFSKNRGDKFYNDAAEHSKRLTGQFVITLTVVLLLSLATTHLLMKGIKVPLTELTAATLAFRMGKRDTRCHYTLANEFGALADAFNTMADTIETEIQVDGSAAQLASVMLHANEAHHFCRELLKGLMQHTRSEVGAVYLLSEAESAFLHFESIGLSAAGRACFGATELEGELGVAVATRQIQHITDIPADTRFAFATVSGLLVPREIITIPVLSDHTVTAVISLASLRTYDPRTVRLVNQIWSILTARMNGVLAFMRVDALAARLEQQNKELETQQRELTGQAHELSAQNIELEQQKRQLNDASRLKSTFLSNMSHELRTPLNSVIALAGVLSRRLAKTLPEEEHSYLEIIERNGKNLLALINDVLDLSRIESGKEELRVTSFSVRELTTEVVDMFAHQAEEKGIALCNLVAGELPSIHSDRDKLRHILQNLVGNAVKFTEHGQVSIAAAVIENAFEIAVSDSGIGIAVEKIGIIFEEFRQADDSTSRKYGGTGLGLSIARRYAQLLGGDLIVSSELGTGSTFTLRLPMSSPVFEQANAKLQGPLTSRRLGSKNAQAGHGEHILIVEDSEPAVIQLKDILEGAGYRIEVARDGKTALDVVANRLPAAVVLDLMMPGVDGFEVLRSLRAAPRTATLPVLILTAKHVSKEEQNVLALNHVHELIQKGDIDKTGLLAAVAKMLSPRQQLASSPPPSPLRTRRPTRPGKPLVLIVEDNPDNLCTARAMLTPHYEVLEARDGEQGIELARQYTPDVILMDIALPSLDGRQALALLRQDEVLREIPVIAVTASAMTSEREELLEHGFDGYIFKPIDYELLMRVLSEALDDL